MDLMPPGKAMTGMHAITTTTAAMSLARLEP